MKKSYLASKKKVVDIKTLDKEGMFNELFNNWKGNTVPVIEGVFRPKNMVYDVNCTNATADQINKDAGVIIDRLLGLNQPIVQTIPEEPQNERLNSLPYPIKIHSGVGEDIWYKLDDTFLVPKVDITFRYYIMRDYDNYFAMIGDSSEDFRRERQIMDDLYLTVFSYLFNQYHFKFEDSQAEKASCYMRMGEHKKWLQININCFSDS